VCLESGWGWVSTGDHTWGWVPTGDHTQRGRGEGGVSTGVFEARVGVGASWVPYPERRVGVSTGVSVVWSCVVV